MPSKGVEMKEELLAFRPTAQATSPFTDRTRRADPPPLKVATRTPCIRPSPRNHQPGGGRRSEPRRALYPVYPDYTSAPNFVNIILPTGTDIPPEYEMQ